MFSRPFLVTVSLAATLLGCAEGGGARDRDAGLRDGGPRLDGGADATVRFDGGRDAGRIPDGGRDAGRIPDGGRDAGIVIPDAGPPDAGPVCTESPCRLVSPQCGCSTGQACYRDSNGPRTCVAAGTAAPGSACTTSTQCQPGYVCTGQPQGGCWRLCDSNADCVSPAQCVYDVLDSAGNVVPGPHVCSAHCNPVTNSGCPAGWACSVEHEETSEYTYCRRYGTAGRYEVCNDVETNCERGHVCLESTTPGRFICYPWCSAPGAVAECGAGSLCYPWSTVGATPFGVCGAA